MINNVTSRTKKLRHNINHIPMSYSKKAQLFELLDLLEKEYVAAWSKLGQDRLKLIETIQNKS